MRWLAFLAICLSICGCGPARQPESSKIVAAFEIPLPTEHDRSEFLSVLRHDAATEGLHVDAESRQELESLASGIPEMKMTIHAAVWRGSTDDHAEAVVMDERDHLGQVWIIFFRGEEPTRAARFRQRVMQDTRLRWPATLSLPITPTGGIPLHGDLIRTPNGYVVNPSAAARYQAAH